MLLIRPDIIYKMPIHNLNQKIRDNSVLLQWSTKYRDYRNSKLFSIADKFLSSQQDREYDRGFCWDYYFPYKVRDLKTRETTDNPFIEFLRYSLYKPRDILTMLNELIKISSGKTFVEFDFRKMLNGYANYLKGELKDYMLIYMSNEEYTSFYSFFRLFKKRYFSYQEFVEIYNSFTRELEMKKKILPNKMQSPEETLQLLYESSIICHEEQDKMFWCYKERNYANIQPEVKLNSNYSFHKAFAKAFNIGWYY